MRAFLAKISPINFTDFVSFSSPFSRASFLSASAVRAKLKEKYPKPRAKPMAERNPAVFATSFPTSMATPFPSSAAATAPPVSMSIGTFKAVLKPCWATSSPVVLVVKNSFAILSNSLTLASDISFSFTLCFADKLRYSRIILAISRRAREPLTPPSLVAVSSRWFNILNASRTFLEPGVIFIEDQFTKTFSADSAILPLECF